MNWPIFWEGQFQALREAGEPMSIAELAPEAVSPDRNAATYLRRAEKSAMAAIQELSPLADKHDDYYDKGRLNERGVELVEAAFAAYSDVIPLVHRAADSPDYVPDRDYTLPPQPFLELYLKQIQQARGFARLLKYRADVQLARGEREESLRTGLVMLRLDRHFEREPMLIANLVSVAVRGMAVSQIAHALEDGPVTTELHDEVHAEVSRQLQSQAFVGALKSERAFGIDSFRDFKGLGLPGFFDRDECDYLQHMAAEIAVGTAPRHKVQAALAQMSIDSQRAGPLTQLILPATQAAREAQLRSRTLLQCLSVLNAIIRRNPAAGADAPSLDELNLPADITVDPYNDKPLKTKRMPPGWIVYSVGPNFQDDGGKIEKSEDVGVGAAGD